MCFAALCLGRSSSLAGPAIAGCLWLWRAVGPFLIEMELWQTSHGLPSSLWPRSPCSGWCQVSCIQPELTPAPLGCALGRRSASRLRLLTADMHTVHCLHGAAEHPSGHQPIDTSLTGLDEAYIHVMLATKLPTFCSLGPIIMHVRSLVCFRCQLSPHACSAAHCTCCVAIAQRLNSQMDTTWCMHMK